MKNIAEQLSIFLEASSVKACELARDAGVYEIIISRLINGKQGDTQSKKADALRRSMKKLDSVAAKKALG